MQWSATATPGIGAGLTIASSPSGSARCAASRSSELPRPTRPGPARARTHPGPGARVRWFAVGLVRGVGAPGGTIDRPCASRLAIAIADHEVEPQVRYHRRNARLIDALDHRLEWVGTGLFAAT